MTAEIETRAAEMAEQFIAAEIDRAPDVFRRFGEWLSHVLDDDRWKTAERMLLGVREAHEAEMAIFLSSNARLTDEVLTIRAELDQAVAVINDRNSETADLIADIDTAKSNNGKACGIIAEQTEELLQLEISKNQALKILRQSYVTLAFAFNRLHESARSRDGELCLDFQKVRAQIEGYFKGIGVPL